MRLSIVLFEPEIPPNTGNIIRLCANTGADLHLIEPLGFQLEDKQLRRAGLDYHEWANLKVHASLSAAQESLKDATWYALSTKAERSFFKHQFQGHCALLFGPETRGLPPEVMKTLPAEQRLRLPMTKNGRSLNLSNTAAICVYEIWRQWEFIDL